MHGGAWAIPDDEVAAHQAGCLAAAKAGWAILEHGGSAMDAVVAAITVMEDDPMFDAGTGSVLNADGFVELDAALMEGKELRYGAVAGLRRIRNPILLARAVIEHLGTMLVGDGAERFAIAHGLPLIDGRELLVEREVARWHEALANPAFGVADDFVTPQGHLGDTVGAIALDDAGALVVGNSTGGVAHKPVGRVGDTPLVGCGLYADTGAGACACTGIGESITRVVMAKEAVELLRQGCPPGEAAGRVVQKLAERVAGLGGCILLDHAGNVGFAFNTPRMAHAYRTATSETFVVGIEPPPKITGSSARSSP